ncbi:5'-nucleotidase, lipoprotein e(P4) family [Dyella caseinilytica]|uniref:Acid phosphatase n=1 Tax=Dyella caseinilytica TaxID=1849581 RepID=A0ABX7GVW1_9GAMM|nr:HAD family acid phosphatase [Dyella caseinilytica]QRN54009.1 acid phosphatase [Dyella caseinilytica]GFZ90862.1 5'-nucleotidase, lipoprotein e(P4) family [Dyella caseinilytica]
MTKSLSALLGTALVLAGCANQASHAPASAAPIAPAPATKPTVAADDNLNAVAWSQTALEHDLVYLETYRSAQSQLLTALKDKSWDALPTEDRTAPYKGLKPAVILDIDETVLDNSPYQARLIRNGGEYNEADWAKWCKEKRARALPGAVAFTQFAAKHGVAVIYISNRSQDLDTATIDNLRHAGLPVSGPDAFLGLGTILRGCDQVGTEKSCRRQLVGQHYRVLMQFGDQLGDFVSVLSNTDAGRNQAMVPYTKWIGSRWFVLPNPTYGSWEPALFNNEWSAPRDQRRQQKIDALRVD